ncbi:hypothetical protein SK128_014077, partial [Halocaridina rubra]
TPHLQFSTDTFAHTLLSGSNDNGNRTDDGSYGPLIITGAGGCPPSLEGDQNWEM